MKYFLAIMACMMLDIIEPTGCSRDIVDSDVPQTDVVQQDNVPAQTPAE